MALSCKNPQEQKQEVGNFTSNSPCCFCSEASKFLPLNLASQGTIPWNCSWELMLEQPRALGGWRRSRVG